MTYDAESTLAAHITNMAKELVLPPGATVVLDAQRTSILMAAVRVRSTGTVEVSLEEKDGDSWCAAGNTEVLPGTTVWHFQLKRPVFRLRLENPSPNPVTVSVDALLPCPVSRER